LDQTGNASVALPSNAIYDAEILDEPGVASYTNGTVAYELALDDFTTLASRSIVVPDAGYVLVIATGQALFLHTLGTGSYCDFGVSDDDASLPVNQDVLVQLPATLPSSTYNVPVTVHGLFSVAAAGTFTYYLLGNLQSGYCQFNDMQLTLLYVPTSYGIVNPTLAGAAGGADESGSRPGLTAAEIATERAQSLADNDARIERELAEMKRQIEELQREVGNR